MKHKFNKLLCLVLAILMIVSMLPATMFASAADKVVMSANQLLVDDDFAERSNKETVTATVGGVLYEAEMGTNAFATITEAISKAPANSAIYVAAGVYEETFNITQNIEIYGNGMNINPNNDDWSLSSKRANEANETVLNNTLITVTTKALTKFVFNGFTVIGKSSIKEATAGSTFKGIDISYNCFHDTTDISSNQGVIYITGTTVRTGRLSYNRIECSGAAKPFTFRNGNNFTIKGNYIKASAAQTGLWLTAEIADQNVTPGQMKMTVEENWLSATQYPVIFYCAYADLVEVTIRNNIATGGQNGISITGNAGSTSSKNFNIEGNTLSGSKQDLYVYGTTTYDPSCFNVKNNTFQTGKVQVQWESTGGSLDLSYNTFSKTPTVDTTPAAIMYPRYDANGKIIGEIALEDVLLTGVLANGDKSTITGVTVDDENGTATLKDMVDSTFDTIEVKAVAKKADSTITAKYYSDPACTTELTGGNVIDHLKKGNNLVYIKLITSLDNYSYKIYTLTIPRDASHETVISGVKNYEGTVSGNSVKVEIPTTDINPNIQLNVSSGASYKIYTDEALKNPVGGTVINNLPAGSTTYYVQVTAEDGETTATYVMTLTRAPYAATDIVQFNSPEFVTYDDNEEAYLAVYSSKYETVDVDVEVSERATWELFADATCKKSVEPTGITLKTGDNVYYIKVTSEAAAAEQVHKVIFRKESADASKQIYGVTSKAISTEVTADTVSILLDCDTTTYIPVFDYAGSYWKLYSTYENGVLGGEVPNNLLNEIAGGKHTYYIKVIAADQSFRVYTLNLEREFSNKALLTAIGGGTTSYVDRFDFVATTEVKNEGAFTPTFQISDKATIKILNSNGGEVELPLALRAGISEYTIIVTAENGINKTEYQWTITCIGDNVATLSAGVVYDPSWSDHATGDVIYAAINGEIVKIYYGENAYSSLTLARAQAAAKGGILYVMPGVTIDEAITLNGVKLYGANFAVEPNKSNRYKESILTARVTMSGTNAVISGFTLTETAQVAVANNATGVQITNNIFKDEAERTAVAINLAGKNAYNALTIRDNRFELDSAVAAISISVVGTKNLVANNYFDNAKSGAMLTVKAMEAGSTLEYTGNTTVAEDSVALWLGDNEIRAGYLNIHANTFGGQRAASMNAAKATNTFVMNFYNNKVETAKLAVNVTNAPASFATNFTGNENSFDSIDHSFSIEYAASVQTATSPLDIERNYYGTSTPGNDVFDTVYSYKPYYLDADKTYLSNVIQPTVITAGGREIVEDGTSNFAVIPGNETELAIKFITNSKIPNGTYGFAYVSENQTFTTDTISVSVSGETTVYAQVVSADNTVAELKEIVLYPQTANPVYNVYDVVSSTIENMTVRVVVDNKATTWSPSLATVDNLPITFYSDVACTQKINGDVKLATAKTTVYGVVGDYETVEFVIYKKQSSEKAILSVQDAYTFEYTGSNTADLTIDNRLTTADLTAVVSEGSWYEVFGDAACNTPVDETAVAPTVTKLYYKVTAADDTVKVFDVSIAWIDVVDPTLISVSGAKTSSFEDDVLVAQISKYNANEGFVTKLVTNAGCTYKLYVDEEHEMLYKNNTVFFSANYVYVYATVTSPDGVVTKDYKITLTKDPGTIKFVDQSKIPNWAKKAVEVTKHLGIVNGEKVSGGYLLNANGNATREVMATFMIRMLGVDASQYSYVDLAAQFADADQVSSWAVTPMKAAVALGIFNGAKNGDSYYLNPKNNITRQEFATVFVRAIGAEDVNVKTYALSYKDAASIATWARTYVKIISKLGYMKGSYGNFNPKDSVTRAEIIQTIYNYMY